jgi:choline dehydrogenase-like flavoprotein
MNDRVFWYTQAKVVGGGSSINAQIYTRGNAGDYDAWRRRTAARAGVIATSCLTSSGPRTTSAMPTITIPMAGRWGFPIRLRRCRSARAYFQAGQEMGIPFNPDFNGAKQEGLGYYQLTQKDARRSSASVAYLKPVRDRRNLTVRTDALVTRVVVEKGRAVGVRDRR